jgi:hypothetical protein
MFERWILPVGSIVVVVGALAAGLALHGHAADGCTRDQALIKARALSARILELSTSDPARMTAISRTLADAAERRAASPAMSITDMCGTYDALLSGPAA